jgi:hypothetical protein
MPRLFAFMLALALLIAPAALADAPPPPPAALTPPDAPASAPETPAGRALGKALRSLAGEEGGLEEADFAAGFLKQVPFATFRTLTGQIRDAEGAITLDGVEPGATDRALVALVTGSKKRTPFRLRVNLDDEGKVAGLLIQPAPDRAVPAIKDWAELDERLGKVPGTANFGAYELIADDAGRPDRVVAAHVFNEDKALAIGSTFKLWVLGAFASEPWGKGTAFPEGWQTPIAIDPARKSLPSGVMQDQPDGKAFPVREFAAKMISISDNTATDHLLHRVGRENVERFMAARCDDPGRNRPFLSTRELFVLKLNPASGVAERYMAADEGGRRAMLGPDGEVTKGTPSLAAAAFWSAPRFIDRLEWFATPRDLARTMASLHALMADPAQAPLREVLSINPGLPIDKARWTYAGYKGGSEPGVLNLTWLLERRDGRTFVLTLGVNDPKRAVKEADVLGLAMRAIERLADEP